MADKSYKEGCLYGREEGGRMSEGGCVDERASQVQRLQTRAIRKDDCTAERRPEG